MIKCRHCGEMIAESDLHCPECGKMVSEGILDQFESDSSSPDANDAATGLKGNNILGDLDITGTKIDTNAYNADNSVNNSSTVTDNSSVQSTVYNQTVIDESKSTVFCDLSGRKVLVTNSCQCPSCGRTVSMPCYIADKMRCSQCEADAESKYKEFYYKVMAGDGVLDSSVRKMLDNKAEEFKLSPKQKEEIEFLLRKSAKKQLSTKLSGIRLKEFDRLLQQLSGGDIDPEAALSKVDSIRKTTQDERVVYWYYLLCATTSPRSYLEDLKSANVDVYWQQYWSFFAYLNNKQVDMAASAIDELKDKYVDNSNDFTLAENIILLRRYSETGDDSYLSDVKSSIKVTYGTESAQLQELYDNTNGAVGGSKRSSINQFYATCLLPKSLMNSPQKVTAEKPANSSTKSTSSPKGFVLDDSAGAPLVIETPPTPTPTPTPPTPPTPPAPRPSTASSTASTATPPKRNNMAIIAAVAAVIVIGGALFMFSQGGDSDKATSVKEVVIEEPKEVENTPVEAVVVEEPVTTPQPTTTQPSTTPQRTTMAGQASSSSSSQSTQTTEILTQAESAYKSEDYAKAVTLYKQAANMGSKDACLMLSGIYTTGAGSISANAMQAKMWSDKAAKLN